MDQGPIVLCLARDVLSSVVIHSDLLGTLSPEVVGDSFVTRYLCDTKFTALNPPASSAKPERELDDCDEAILLALAE
jgi:hypothetical protein